MYNSILYICMYSEALIGLRCMLHSIWIESNDIFVVGFTVSALEVYCITVDKTCL